MILAITAALVFLTILLLHVYISSNFDYWKKRNIFYLKPMPFFGNFSKIGIQYSMGVFLKKLYEKVDQPFFGLFMIRTPYLIIRDPNLAKRIMVQDFDSFYDRSVHSNPDDEISGKLLMCMKLKDWKIMRQKLTPFFSPGKLKNMFDTFNEIADDMVNYIDENSINIEAKEMCANYTIDVISRCAFGIESNCFLNENAEFKTKGTLYFNFSASAAFRFILYYSMPLLVEFFKISLFNSTANNFMRKVLTESISNREKNPMVGNDLIDIILELKRDDEFCKKYKFYGDTIIAQPIMMFIAAFETSSSLISFTLYELAIHPNIQTKVRREIQRILELHGNLNYECMQEMEYLDMVFSEVLRKYPSVPYTDRICTKEYKIPDSETVIEEGTKIMIPIMGMHYDEEYFPKPYDFIPERFSDMKRLPPAYMPFGDGPKKCIGARFGIINSKVAISKILMNFEVLKAEKTPVPIVFEAKSLTLASKFGLPLDFKKLVQ